MRLNARVVTAGVLALGFTYFSAPLAASAAQTAAATPIFNTATASYTDNNAVVYGIASNPVVAVVQNAPVVTVSNPGGQVVTPNEVVVDSFVVTNSGNGTGTFQLPADATVGANGTLRGYTLPAGFVVPVGGTVCTAAAPCTLAQINTDLAGTNYATGISLTIGVEYAVSATPTGTTVPVTLSVTMAYTAQTLTVNGTAYTAAAQTSVATSGLETDTLTNDARLDIQKVAAAPTSASSPIVFSITANDGGGYAAHDLASAQTLLGAATAGILITDKLPVFGTPDTITLAATPTVTLNGAIAGAHAVLYYTADATGKTGWSTTYSATAAVVGAYITGGAAATELPSNPAGSSGAGAVTAAQVTLSISITQPTGAGAGNAGSVSNIANSAIGGNPNANGNVPILGPGIPAGTVDGSANGNVLISNEVVNTTASTGTTTPGGASNTSLSSAFALNSVYVGPVGYPQATGSYPAPPNSGAASADTFNDFTAVSFACTNTSANIVVGANYIAPVASAAGPTCTAPLVNVPLTFYNAGTAADAFTVSAQAPPGYTVALYVGTCTGTITLLTAQVCTPGTAPFAPASAAGGTTQATFPTVLTGNQVPSFATENIIAQYTATAGVPPFAGVDSTITVFGTRDTPTTPERNTTHVDLYPGGAVSLVKTQTIVSSNCNGTPSLVTSAPTGVCPGGIVKYSLLYTNVAPATLATNGSALGTEPTFALNGVSVNGLQITEDGAQQVNGNTSSWALYSYGALQPTDTTAGTTYTTGVAFSTGGTAQGTTHFSALIGGATSYKLQPGSNGTVSFNVTVK